MHSPVTMDELIQAVAVLVRDLRVLLVERVLAYRAHGAGDWTECPKCQGRLRSEVRPERELRTSLGPVR